MKLSARIMLFVIVAGAFFVSSFMSVSVAIPDTESTSRYGDSGSLHLILLRHAKSDKSNMNMPDIDRPLEASGREEAKEMGEELKKNLRGLNIIYSSPSVRTKQTLEIICPIIGYDFSKVVWDSSLYACSGDHIIEFLRGQKIQAGHVMIVGHNPSITDAANDLQKEQSIQEVKTCGVVSIWFPTGRWSEISVGTLEYYSKPR